MWAIFPLNTVKDLRSYYVIYPNIVSISESNFSWYKSKFEFKICKVGRKVSPNTFIKWAAHLLLTNKMVSQEDEKQLSLLISRYYDEVLERR